ncbi:MAG: glutaredoxin family protein [Planctomycetes bacterium]|nr:glutaredoxin family protein [Planctomycetota bacterium]
MPDEIVHVDGDDAGPILVYALSTCVWCRRTKRLLDELGVAYDYVDMDTLDIPSLEKRNRELRRHNPRCSYPTVVFNDAEVVVGFDEEKIRKALGR